MAEARIPVDLLNPGQVFACLGLVEAADLLVGPAAGGFDWRDPADVRFVLSAKGDIDPVAHVLAFLAEAEVTAVAPARSSHDTAKWGVPTRHLDDDRFPFPDPPSPATLPARLADRAGRGLTIEHWGDATDRDNVKFWAGSGGYPGAALARDALELVRDRLRGAAADPFALAAPQSSSFRFDWRRDYIPMDVGFSPNDHPELTMVGFPLVELLAAIGLQHARPQRIRKLDYRYAVIAPPPGGSLLDPIFLRAALGGATQPFAHRRFRMRLGWPGQENQARCITDVFEESP
jgi:CRISPR-associated protein Csx14